MPKIILASGSRTRKKLLEDAGYDVHVIAPEINEASFAFTGISPREYAQSLAYAKAKQLSNKHPAFLIIAADTLVDCSGKIIGKPGCRDDAREILETLCATPHRVITALALICESRGIEIIDSDSTNIYPRPMSQARLSEYLDSGDWKGKSGAYAISPQGDKNIEKIVGSITNVMGLPMELLKSHLTKIKNQL